MIEFAERTRKRFARFGDEVGNVFPNEEIGVDVSPIDFLGEI